MDPPERLVASPQLPADEDVGQSAGQTSINLLGALSNSEATQDQRQPTVETNGREPQQLLRHSLQPGFQDSNLSPALPLLPVNSGVDHMSSEYSLFLQSDNEFAPLRAYPDISMASERFHLPPLDRTTRASEDGSLSQHPLAQATTLSEEGRNSCWSLSQHSLSPGEEVRRKEIVHSPLTATAESQGVTFRNEKGDPEKDLDTQSDPQNKPVGETAEDETFFLSKEIPAQHLLQLLQKDIGMPSSSSSAVSSASETSVKIVASFSEESKSTQVCKPGMDQSKVRREGPPGEASLPQQQTQQQVRDSYPDRSRTLSSEVCNITVGLRSTQPDASSKLLHRELLSDVERRSSCEAGSENQQRKSPVQSLTPCQTKTSKGKPSVTRTNLGDVPWTGPFSVGIERGHREQDLWSSGNQTGIDGSYLGFLPQSQSTPGVFKAPPKSSVKANLGQLSAIESSKENSCESKKGISPQPAVPVADFSRPDPSNQCQEEATSAKVQSLPSLNYMQKVDAWRANQTSGKTSLFDSLALQGFSGISPKKKAYDAVSDTLNRILSQQARSLQQPPVSSAAIQNITQMSSTAPSGSLLKRGEAVGSAPGDKDNTGSSTRPSASSFGRSQSHSSLSTVVTVKKDQQTETLAENEKSQTHSEVHHQPSATGQPSPLVGLGQFSDVSTDQDLTLSSSQESYNNGNKLGTSVGASSVVSLEVDNYAPYWTSKPSTPRPRELNIEERIPLYLHNLGIDQSPSAILTPFAPRGPIREPEFSPTDLCTIKGSIGTSTKSTQPSEGDSPHKGEFSRSSILSVDSSMSIPFSLDSLGPAASVPERTRRASPSSDTEDLQSERRLTSSSQPDEDSYPSTLQTALHQHRDSSLTSSQNTIQLEDRLESDLSLAADAKCGGEDLESPLQTSRSMEKSAEASFVSSKALLEIRKLLSQAENVVSAGSSVATSFSPGAHRPVSDENIFLSLRKKSSILQDSSFSSSSATGDPRSQSSLLCVRSSSDSMLSSEKMRESLIGQESMASSWQSNNQPTQASTTAPSTDAYKMQQDSTVSRGVGSSFVLSQSARRAEPEGCSAAPPDNKVPPQPPVIKPSPALSTQQLTSTPTDVVGVTEDEKLTTLDGPVLSSSSSPILEETDQGVQSDGSSESSLAIRVAKLLQSESPATMVSSTASITDQEESKAREWIKLKISGQQCEPLELDKEDRKRIEEIKRELLLKNPIKSQGSTDTESSAASSIRVQRGQDPAQQTEPFTALSDANIQTAQALQSCSEDPSDSTVQLPPRPNLEAQIREIAAREGVNLPRTNPRALTSITIATRRRSTSSSPSVSPVPPLSPAPELLQLTELSTGAVELPKANRRLPPTMEEKDRTTMQPASVCEPSSSFHTRNQNLTPQSAPGDQRRQATVGGQFEEPLPPSQALGKEDVTVEEDNIQFLGRDEELSGQDGSVSGDNEAKQATGSSSPDSPARTAHVSHVRLTLSPKATDQSLATAVLSSHADAVQVLPRKEFVPLRHSSSAASSLDEGVGLSSPPDWYDNREPIRQQRPERADTSTLFKTAVPERRMTSTSPQPFTPCHRVVMTPRPLTTESPAVLALLPYKPRGSEELFYVPQTEADFSSTDTTMESTHTGSDDAVPPSFSSEVLGHRDPGLDRGVTIRHTEGIYSKRLKTAAFKMHEPEHRGVSVSADKSSQTSVTRAPKSSSQVSFAFTRVPLSSSQEASKRDQGTSPMQFPSGAQPEPSREGFQPVRVETDYDKAGHHLDRSSVPQAGGGRDQERRDSDLLHHAAQQSSSSLDQLWQRFCDEWSVEESRPTRDREASLLERLERLSRLIHSTKGTSKSEAFYDPEERLGGRGEDATGRARKKPVVEVKRSAGGGAREMEWKVRGGGKVEGEPLVPQQAWTQRLQVEETSPPADEESFPSSFSPDPSPGRHVCPADRDESETLSTTSGSMSTVDTARLIRAFGAHRVQHLKASSGLGKLYNTINKQKDRREQSRARNKEQHHMVSLSETTGTDESTVAGDSASSASTYTLPSHHSPSRTPTAKKAVKMVSKGIQAGDLELVSNGTRRHTRDVGTTFPSPGEATTSRPISSSSSSSERGRGGRTHRLQRQRESKKSPSKTHPEGVSWFISADDLRSEARKENRPQEEESTWRPSTAWFEPYSRIRPWREPLRQRQVHEDGNKQPGFAQHAEPDSEPRTKTGSSGLARISLQEALEMRRPEFISQSRQRVRRLALQVEERKLQEVFSRERDELFSRPGGPGRLPKPAGTALLRRAVPRKEMIQRSKQIYESLPEVQRRREEERRRAEYQSYRLNAQLFNKRITSRVLGRRTAWQ